MARGTYRLIRKRTQESEGRWKCQTHTRQLKSRPLERFASSNVPSVNRAPVRFASASKLVASATRMSSRSRDYSPTLNFLAFPGTKRSDVSTVVGQNSIAADEPPKCPIRVADHRS